jgi:hypothetical protein
MRAPLYLSDQRLSAHNDSRSIRPMRPQDRAVDWPQLLYVEGIDDQLQLAVTGGASAFPLGEHRAIAVCIDDVDAHDAFWIEDHVG